MMYTEDDIRRVLETELDRDALQRLTRFAADLGPPDELGGPSTSLDIEPSGRHRSRVLPLIAAAAAVIVLAGGAAVLMRSEHGNDISGASAAMTAEQRRPVWNLRVSPVKGYTVTQVNASSIGLAYGSTLSIAATSVKRPERGTLTTCPERLNSCSDPTGAGGAAKAHPVTVHGRQGFFFAGHHVPNATLHQAYYRRHDWRAAQNSPVTQAGVAWYAGHRTTVFLFGTFGFDPRTHSYDNAAAKTTLLRIASTVSAGHHDPTRLPFELQNLPGRVAPESVRIEYGQACSEFGTGAQNVNDPLGVVFTACRVRTGATRAATIATADRVDSNPTNGPTRFAPDHPVVQNYGDGTSLLIAVEPDKRKTVSQQQAQELAADADVSPRLEEMTTWLVVK